MEERIYTEDEYRRALVRFLELSEAEEGTPEYREFIWLMECMEEYEKENC